MHAWTVSSCQRPSSNTARIHFTPQGYHHAFDARIRPITGVTTPRPDRIHCRIPAGLPLDRLAAHMLMAWAQEAVTCGLPLPPDDLISWWPRMQLCYTRVARPAQATQAQQRHDATAATNVARTALVPVPYATPDLRRRKKQSLLLPNKSPMKKTTTLTISVQVWGQCR